MQDIDQLNNDQLKNDQLKNAQLSDEQQRAFDRNGFVVMPGWFAPQLMRELVAEIDAYEDGGRVGPIWALPVHGMLTSHPSIMGVMEQLLGADFLFHHIHTYRHGEGAPGVAWHNDYEQVPQTNRSHRNIIVLVYPNGLDGRIGDLVVVPGTHTIVSDWYQLSCFGNAVMPGEVVIDALPPGSAVIAHTGLLHARRPKPGAGQRYFTDTSYCQLGIPWPSWSEGDWRAMYDGCLASGYDRGGRYRHLFDASQFFDQREARRRLDERNTGSLWPRLDAADMATVPR